MAQRDDGGEPGRDPTLGEMVHADMAGGDCDGCIQTFGVMFMSAARQQEAAMNSPWAYTHIESLSTGLPALTHLAVEVLTAQNARNVTTDFPRAFAALRLKHLDLIRCLHWPVLPILKSLRKVPGLTSLTVPSAEHSDLCPANSEVIDTLRALPALKTLHLSCTTSVTATCRRWLKNCRRSRRSISLGRNTSPTSKCLPSLPISTGSATWRD